MADMTKTQQVENLNVPEENSSTENSIIDTSRSSTDTNTVLVRIR